MGRAVPARERAMSLLRATDLQVRTEGRTLLDLPELEVGEREILVVLGPTGAGKSTLLRMLGLLQRPARGRLAWRGAPIPWPAPLALRRRMAMVFQAPLLFSGTVFDNVAYGLRLRGERGAALSAKVEVALDQFHVAHLAARRAATLSGGEAQRVALARAVVIEPELLLLDEPLASLDAPIREHLRDELRQVIRARGMSCVHVTHELPEAFTLADRIAVLAAGRLLQVGRPEEVFYAPNQRAVAEFLRAGNLLAGEVVESAGGMATVRIAGRTLAAASALAPGRRVLACIHPEEVRIERPGVALEPGSGAAPDPGAGVVLEAVVVCVTDRGPTLRLDLDCGFPLRALVTRRAARELALVPGARVAAAIAPGSVHLIPDDDARNMAP
jgi:tungstate transport system ATP-binding protein